MAKKERKPPQRPSSEAATLSREDFKRCAGHIIDAWHARAARRFRVYRNLFPWFGSAMLRAGYPIESKATAALIDRADREWESLTGLPPLFDDESWAAAAYAAKLPAPTDWDSITTDKFLVSITAWAKSVAAEKRRGGQNGKAGTDKGKGQGRTRKRLTETQKKYLRWYRSELTAAEIAKKEKCHPSTVSKGFKWVEGHLNERREIP